MKIFTFIKHSAHQIFFGIVVLSFLSFPGAHLVHAENVPAKSLAVTVTEDASLNKVNEPKVGAVRNLFNQIVEILIPRESKQLQEAKMILSRAVETDRQVKPAVVTNRGTAVITAPVVPTDKPSRVPPRVVPATPATPVKKPVTSVTLPDPRATAVITSQSLRPTVKVSYDNPEKSIIDPNRPSVCKNKDFNRDNYRVVDLRAGTDDNFATPTESAGQYAGSPMYVDHRRVDGQGFAGLNDKSVNNRRVFSFDLSGYDNIACAYFYMDLHRLDDPLTSTDSFFVHSFSAHGTGTTPEYCNDPGELSCFGVLMTDKDPDFLSGPADQFYTFDLSELARHGGKSVDFIKAINQNHNLHFGIQDDTAVDYAGVILYIPR